MQAATAEQKPMDMGRMADQHLDDSTKRRQAERLLDERGPQTERNAQSKEEQGKPAAQQARSSLRSLRERGDLSKLAKAAEGVVKESEVKQKSQAEAGVSRREERLRRQVAAAKAVAEPEVATADIAGQGGDVNPSPRQQTAFAQPARRRARSVWSFGVWFSGTDWVRFAVSAIVIIMLGQVMSIVVSAQAHASTRIKDIVAVEGVRDNLLVGYGLVVGLDGTGDKLRNSAFTEQSLVAFLERLGVNTRESQLKTKNVAAVTVTATLPPFARQGSRIDVSVSAMGDAASLQGGTLLATPLYAADGQVYTVAQGAVAVGGFSAGGDASAVTKGVPTSAAIANGGIVEREIAFDLNALPSIDLALRNPDVTTATRIAAVINKRMGGGSATLRDPATVRVNVPEKYRDNVTMLLAQIEQLPVETDQVARVVIDEATGTIVMGENVRVDTVAVAQGNLIVKVEETPQVSQPGAFAPPGAQTVVVPRTNVAVDEEESNQMVVLNRGATLNELVAGLNALGVGPRDLITILQTIKAAGALQADIQTR